MPSSSWDSSNPVMIQEDFEDCDVVRACRKTECRYESGSTLHVRAISKEGPLGKTGSLKFLDLMASNTFSLLAFAVISMLVDFLVANGARNIRSRTDKIFSSAGIPGSVSSSVALNLYCLLTSG